MAGVGVGNGMGNPFTPAASGPVSGRATPRRRTLDADPQAPAHHSGLTPNTKATRPAARADVPEKTGNPLMDNQQLTDAVFTLHARQEADVPWLREMYDTIVQHADALDQLSQYVITNKTKSDGDMLGVAVKAHSELEALRSDLTENTKITFHQVDADLDKLKAELKKVEAVIEYMGSANIEGKFAALEGDIQKLKSLEQDVAGLKPPGIPTPGLEGSLLKKAVEEHEKKVEYLNATLGETRSECARNTAEITAVTAQVRELVQQAAATQQQQQPSQHVSATEAGGQGTAPVLDPWAASLAGTAGSGSAPPMRGPSINIGSPLGIGSRPPAVSSSADQKTMFDDKTAMVPATQLGSGYDAYKWRKHTTNYLVGRTRCMLPFLKWIERQTDKTTNENLSQRILSDPAMPMMDREPSDLSHGLWSFLNLNLAGDPKRKFEAIEPSNGAEVWRKIVGPLVSKSEERRHFLIEGVNNPRACTSMADLMKCIEDWEAAIELYVAADGCAPPDEQRRQKLVRLIPHTDDEKVYELLGKYKSYDALREYLEKKCEWLVEYKAPKRTAHLTEGSPAADGGPLGTGQPLPGGDLSGVAELLEQVEGEDGDENSLRGQLLAIVNKHQQQRGRQPFRAGARRNPRAPPGGAKTPPRDRRDVRCGNCGDKGHTSGECKKEKVPFELRKCHKCGQPGHLAMNCKNKPQARLADGSSQLAIADGPAPQRAYGMMVTAVGDGWREVVSRPRPRTLADAVVKPTGSQKQRRGLSRGADGNSFALLRDNPCLSSYCDNFQTDLLGAAVGTDNCSNIVNVASPHVDNNTIYSTSSEIKSELASAPDTSIPTAEFERPPRVGRAHARWTKSRCQKSCCSPTQGIPEFPPLTAAPIVNGEVPATEDDSRVRLNEGFVLAFKDARSEGMRMVEAMADSEGDSTHGLIDDTDSEDELAVQEKRLVELKLERARKRQLQRQRRSLAKVAAADVGAHSRPAPSGDKPGGGVSEPDCVNCHASCVFHRTVLAESDDEVKGSTPTKAGTRPDQGEEKTSYTKPQACVNSSPIPANEFSYEKLLTLLDSSPDLDEFKRLILGDAAERHGLAVGEGVPAHHFPVLGGGTGGSTHLLEATSPAQLMVNDASWEDVEFEVALDSGCTDHVCADVDTPGYVLEESAASRCGGGFTIGDGGILPNQGQKRLQLENDAKLSIDSVFQIARVARPLMSVGRICDLGNSIAFSDTTATVMAPDGKQICQFVRKEGGLYIAKLKLKRPKPPFGGPP